MTFRQRPSAGELTRREAWEELERRGALVARGVAIIVNAIIAVGTARSSPSSTS